MDVAEFRLAVLLLCRAKEVQAATDSLVESLQKKKNNNLFKKAVLYFFF